MHPDKISAIIVDDEQLAIDLIAGYLREFPEISVAASCTRSKLALERILELKPDLLFLDIKMPVMNGFQLLEALAGRHKPYVIFTTAYDAFAVRAFEVNAVGYLLKPFEQGKFTAAVRHFIQEYTGRRQDVLYNNLRRLLAEQVATPDYLRRVLIREKQKIFYIPVSDIQHFEAAGDYIKAVTAARTYLLNDSLSAMESRLDPEAFARVHRSLIINAAQVKEFIPYTNGEYTLVMQNGDTLKTSRSYKAQLTRIFREL